MTRSQTESTIHSGAAFTLRMAEGREYAVPHRDYISVSPQGTGVTVGIAKEKGKLKGALYFLKEILFGW